MGLDRAIGTWVIPPPTWRPETTQSHTMNAAPPLPTATAP